MTITLRQESTTGATTKGSALTFSELDNNFIDVLNNKIQALQVDGNSGSVNVGQALSNGVLSITGTGSVTTAVTEDSAGNADLVITGSGLANVVEDTTPQLGGTLDAQGNEINNVILEDYKETIYTGGSTTGTITPDVVNGNVQSITLTGSITFNAFSNPEAGQTMTLIVKQPSSGGPYTLTSTMKFAGGTKTLSTAADAIDIISVLYDGTNYWASLSTNFS
jgi:hypothetical protein